MKLIIVLFCIIVVINISCTTEINNTENMINYYNEVSNILSENTCNIIVESNLNNTDNEFIEIQDNFGINRDVFTHKLFFRNYIAFPYYSIRKFKNALSGILISLSTNEMLEKIIKIKTGELEIEYFGRMKISDKIKINDLIKKNTLLGEMLGGGDAGMKLKIRMRYKGRITDPSLWFDNQENPTTGSS